MFQYWYLIVNAHGKACITAYFSKIAQVLSDMRHLCLGIGQVLRLDKQCGTSLPFQILRLKIYARSGGYEKSFGSH